MTEETGPTRRRVGCLVSVLLVLVVGGVVAWRVDALADFAWVIGIYSILGGIGFGVHAAAAAIGRLLWRTEEREAMAKDAATTANTRHREATTPGAAGPRVTGAATAANWRHREWRRVGTVLSAVAAVLALLPFGRSVALLLRAYEQAEASGLRELGWTVLGRGSLAGFPGLLHASAAVLMTAATIVLFAGLALLLASDVWLPGRRNDATEANRAPNRPKATSDSGR